MKKMDLIDIQKMCVDSFKKVGAIKVLPCTYSFLGIDRLLFKFVSSEPNNDRFLVVSSVGNMGMIDDSAAPACCRHRVVSDCELDCAGCQDEWSVYLKLIL